MFVKQRGRFSRQLRRCATAQELLCAREVLDNRIGIGAAGERFSGLSHSVCRLLVRNHRDQFRVLDNVSRVLLSPGSGPDAHSSGSRVADRFLLR